MIHQFTLDTLEFNLTSFIMSWLAVNANGERYGAEMPFEPMLTNARMNTPGQAQGNWQWRADAKKADPRAGR